MNFVIFSCPRSQILRSNFWRKNCCELGDFLYPPAHMQYFTLIGGFTGFVLAFLVSLVAGKNLEDSVFNATMVCILTALLFRVFRSVIEYCAKQVVAEKARLRDIEKATAAEAMPPADSTPETPAQPAA